MTHERLHYTIVFRLDGSDRCLIWYTDDVDGVLLDESKLIATFRNPGDVQAYMANLGLDLVEGPPEVYDLDRIAGWVAEPGAEGIDCVRMLNAWNVLADTASTLSCKLFEPRGANLVYDKLFWGNNLEALTPSGEHFEPTWSTAEVAILAGVLSAGLSALRTAIGRPLF
jgi:hypothetical protein